MNNKKQGLYLSLVATAIIIPLIISFSYAYFAANISGSGSNMSGNVVTGMSFNLNMQNNAYISATNILPIEDYDVDDMAEVGTFTVEAGANPYPISYSISLTDITIPAELKTADFKWKVTCISNGAPYDVATGSFANYTTDDLELATGLLIDPSSTEDFEIRLWITNTDSNQIDILNKSFSGKVKIAGEYITSKIPDTYQEVEWLGSSGTQYIKTGVMTTNGITKQSTEIQVSRLSQRQLSGNDYGWYFEVTANNYYGNGSAVNVMPSTESFDKLSIISNYGAGTRRLYVNGSFFTTNTASTSSGLNKEIYIFRLNASNAYAMTAKIKSFKISTSGELKRYFVPCYRKADNAAGFYDLVSKTFFDNKGTGSFTVGNDV